MPIKVLPQKVIAKIAAGEIVERPASVVKELVENSLDAGATEISIETHGSGLKLIKVSDDGCGIPKSQVNLAFERYATSKISTLDDLQRISTLGFRGEALPSIAAVSQVELVTRTEEDDTGTLVLVENGTIVSKEPRSHRRGTSVTVRHLFRNFPPRLKFMKSATTENGHIADIVYHYALAFPEVRFRLLLEGREILSTSGSSKLQDVLATVYGPDFAEQMIEIEERQGSLLISGFLGPPSLSRPTRGHMDFFINRRWVRNNILTRAVEEAYHGWLMSERYPVVVLNVSLPCEELDVNVHPAKAEVKFRNSQAVFTSIRYCVQRRLEAILGARPLYTQAGLLPRHLPTSQNNMPDIHLLRVIGQLANTYIVAEGPSGLFLIDQHAAHERVLFEKILEQRSRQKVETQGLLEPVCLELDPKQDELVRDYSNLLQQFGIKLEPFGIRAYLLRAVPAVMKGTNLAETVRNLIDSLGNEAGPEKLAERVALSLACHSSVKAGDSLSSEEMIELARQLEETSQPQTCPHGRPTMVHLSSHDLRREFGRLR